MTLDSKQRRVIALVATLIATLLLAASLSNLDLLPGKPFPGASLAEDARFSQATAALLKVYAFPFLQGILALVFALLLIYTLTRLLQWLDLKRIARWGLGLVVLLGAMLAIPRTPIGQVAHQPGGFTPMETAPAEVYNVTPLGTPPPGIVWLAGVILLGSLGLVVVRALKRQGGPPQNGDPFLEGAEAAAQALQAGLDLHNVILRCYAHMSQAIQEERGMAREGTLTAREFERALADQGFPAGPVHQLTALFERVRYGTHLSDSRDEALALDSLEEIIRYCRQGRQPAHEAD